MNKIFFLKGGIGFSRRGGSVWKEMEYHIWTKKWEILLIEHLLHTRPMLFPRDIEKRCRSKGCIRLCETLNQPIWGSVSKFSDGNCWMFINKKKNKKSPYWCGLVGWATSCKAKVLLFDSQLRHMPGLLVVPRAEHVQKAMDPCFSLSSPLHQKEKKKRKTSASAPAPRISRLYTCPTDSRCASLHNGITNSSKDIYWRTLTYT